MQSLSLFLGLLAFVTPSLAAAVPSPAPLHTYDGPVNGNVYIVKIADGVDKTPVVRGLPGDAQVAHDWNPKFMNAFTASLSDAAVEALRANPAVEYIAPDGVMTAFDTQTDASWNLARISTKKKLTNQDPYALNYKYNYLSNPGNDIDIYVVDTGIYVDHPDFEGRASWGGAFCAGCTEEDGNGHGTHVAGTAGGKRSGVAKKANLIAIKVLGDDGSGTVAGIIDGLEWIYLQHEFTERASIATMSLGGGNSPPLDDAVQQLIDSGIHCTIAAGNSNVDAKDTSPANTRDAITVGATDIADSRAFYSNFGDIVDVFAPGSNVTSTWNDGKYKTISGTSMATPAVAGLVAYFLPIVGKDTAPAKMRDYIVKLATKDILSNIPQGTANVLVNNGNLSS